MKIGDLSRRTGVSIRMLRYYETEGLLSPARTANGYRDYEGREVETIDRIKALSAAGMTLPTIRQFLPCELESRGSFEPCDELKSTLQRQIDKVDQEVERLEVSRAVLSNLLAEMEQQSP